MITILYYDINFRVSCSQLNLRVGIRWHLVAFSNWFHSILGVGRYHFGRSLFAATELAPPVYSFRCTRSALYCLHVVSIRFAAVSYEFFYVNAFLRITSICILLQNKGQIQGPELDRTLK